MLFGKSRPYTWFWWFSMNFICLESEFVKNICFSERGKSTMKASISKPAVLVLAFILGIVFSEWFFAIRQGGYSFCPSYKLLIILVIFLDIIKILNFSYRKKKKKEHHMKCHIGILMEDDFFFHVFLECSTAKWRKSYMSI